MQLVYTNGRRNELKLTNEQRNECLTYVQELGFEYDVSFSEYCNTAFVCSSQGEQYCRLIIGTDVYPIENPKTPNEAISYRGAIAHELVGHYEAWIGNFECKTLEVDEAQASIRAARFAPALSKAERLTLIRDALVRLKKGNISLQSARLEMHIEMR